MTLDGCLTCGGPLEEVRKVEVLRLERKSLDHIPEWRRKWNHVSMADIEQVLREQQPCILRCRLAGIKTREGRRVPRHRCAVRVSITAA